MKKVYIFIHRRKDMVPSREAITGSSGQRAEDRNANTAKLYAPLASHNMPPWKLLLDGYFKYDKRQFNKNSMDSSIGQTSILRKDFALLHLPY